MRLSKFLEGYVDFSVAFTVPTQRLNELNNFRLARIADPYETSLPKRSPTDCHESLCLRRSSQKPTEALKGCVPRTRRNGPQSRLLLISTRRAPAATDPDARRPSCPAIYPVSGACTRPPSQSAMPTSPLRPAVPRFAARSHRRLQHNLGVLSGNHEKDFRWTSRFAPAPFPVLKRVLADAEEPGELGLWQAEFGAHTHDVWRVSLERHARIPAMRNVR